MKDKLLKSLIGGTLLLSLAACGDAEVQKKIEKSDVK